MYCVFGIHTILAVVRFINCIPIFFFYIFKIFNFLRHLRHFKTLEITFLYDGSYAVYNRKTEGETISLTFWVYVQQCLYCGMPPWHLLSYSVRSPPARNPDTWKTPAAYKSSCFWSALSSNMTVDRQTQRLLKRSDLFWKLSECALIIRGLQTVR